MCSSFGVLPSSFVLPPESVQRGDPFASGGYSTVYKGTFRDLPVVIKVLKVATETDQKKLRRVSSPGQKMVKRLLTLHLQLLVREVIGWKWLRHENILPFIGVMFTPPHISIASEHMDNGNITQFIRANRDYNRLGLVSEGRMIFLSRIDCLDSL